MKFNPDFLRAYAEKERRPSPGRVMRKARRDLLGLFTSRDGNR